jgi:hypothetical protein
MDHEWDACPPCSHRRGNRHVPAHPDDHHRIRVPHRISHGSAGPAENEGDRQIGGAEASSQFGEPESAKWVPGLGNGGSLESIAPEKQDIPGGDPALTEATGNGQCRQDMASGPRGGYHEGHQV